MIKRILHTLSSPILMGVLFLLLAASMGMATFVENDFGTNAAKALFYNSWWFEGIFILLGINMLISILRPHMWKKGKRSILIFHISFLLIVLGAGITRYIGFEGTMQIREGQTSNTFISSDNFIIGSISAKGKTKHFDKRVFISTKSKDNFSKNMSIADKDIQIQSVGYMPNTELKPFNSTDGISVVSLIVSSKTERKTVNLSYGESIVINGYTIGFNHKNNSDFNIYKRDKKLYFSCTHKVYISDMTTKEKTNIDMDKEQQLYQNMLLGFDDMHIMQTAFYNSASFRTVHSSNDKSESIALNIKVNGLAKVIYLASDKDKPGQFISKIINGVKIKICYGKKLMTLPFSIKLNHFKIERYPGSDSPSSFASEVTLTDKKNNVKRNTQIFMNNILSYKSYRFYQASYNKDEKGTVLSVNNDLWGTALTYIGYALLALFMILALFSSKSRFRYLARQVSDISKNKKVLSCLLLVLMGSSVFAQNIDKAIVVTKSQAQKFGALWVQDNEGRIKPVNTVSGEILRKLVKFNSFNGYTADQVTLSMLVAPNKWSKIPMITVKTNSIKSIVGNTKDKASYSQFFDTHGHYKLDKLVNNAYRSRPADRNKLQSELLKIDEQVNVFYMAQSGGLLRLFPNIKKTSAPWLTPLEIKTKQTSTEKANITNTYISYIKALKNNKIKDADKLINKLAKYQQDNAKNILPSDNVKSVEIFYNKMNLFLMLAPFVFMIGLILFSFQISYLFSSKDSPKYINTGGKLLVLLCFVFYTLGLILRWYISGHAPWSNGYESMLYIGWSILLAGLSFSKQSPMILSLGSLFAGIVLFVAHLSWMNPEITNLVPVLKSYWLTIHVAVIVGSYGFLSLAALMSFVSLIFMSLQKNKNNNKITSTIKELSYVSEMGLIIGIYALTIGAFIGGVWANESWGRYWGWDPKETWTLVTILVYAFVLHLRMIPNMKSILCFNVAAVIGFFSIIMTYLGVNYYLTGMHSYAQGEPVPIPSVIYIIAIVVFVVIALAIYNQHRLRTKE